MTEPDQGPSSRVRRMTAEEFRDRLPELIRLYLAAMRYPESALSARTTLWEEHSRRAGFDAMITEDERGRATGLGYGYHGRPGQWWYNEVYRGVTYANRAWLEDFFELTELHVRPDAQGSGQGQALLTALLRGRPERTVLLSTPEGENRAWRLYRRVGFMDVLRHYRFAGDPRPFGVLGLVLPLAEHLPIRG